MVSDANLFFSNIVYCQFSLFTRTKTPAHCSADLNVWIINILKHFWFKVCLRKLDFSNLRYNLSLEKVFGNFLQVFGGVKNAHFFYHVCLICPRKCVSIQWKRCNFLDSLICKLIQFGEKKEVLVDGCLQPTFLLSTRVNKIFFVCFYSWLLWMLDCLP